MPVSTRSSARKRQGVQYIDQVEVDGEFSMPHVPVHVISATPTDEEQKAESQERGSFLSHIKGDWNSVLLLTFLYILQGIPLGLAGSIPLMLQARGVSYSKQALFSFAFWPFSVKLLWAPVVDSVYVKWLGLRKTWLVATQYLIAVFLLYLSFNINDLMGSPDQTADVMVITATFFCLSLLCATQDIAVDGWALTMLSKRNVGLASTCNTIGQSAGYFLGNVIFLALESADFCNKYLRTAANASDKGIITLDGFFFFWALVFAVTTTLVLMFKSEQRDPSIDSESTMWGAYIQLYRILRLRPVQTLIAQLLIMKIGFAAADAISGLKMVEAGVPKETLAMMALPVIPIQVLLPLVISKYTAGPKPLDVLIKAYPYRLVNGILGAGLVYWTQSLSPADFDMSFYAVVLAGYIIHQILIYCHFVSIMASHARVSDPALGGTYMTMLNTCTNLGGNWPATAVLWLVDRVTWKHCQLPAASNATLGAEAASCYGDVAKQACQAAGGSCLIDFDGYYVISGVCVVIGVFWLITQARVLRRLQSLPLDAWRVRS